MFRRHYLLILLFVDIYMKKWAGAQNFLLECMCASACAPAHAHAHPRRLIRNFAVRLKPLGSLATRSVNTKPLIILCGCAGWSAKAQADLNFRWAHMRISNTPIRLCACAGIGTATCNLVASRLLDHWRPTERHVMTLIRLRECAVWSESSLGAHAILWEMFWPGS